MKVDLNCDLGESFGVYTMGLDEEIIPLVSSVNVACGFHAGDPCVMQKTIALAKDSQIAIGAHPGYPDMLGFGRRNLDITPIEAKNYILYQLGALFAFAKAYSVQIQHIKPHGAMYNKAALDFNLAQAICEAVALFDERIIFLGLAHSVMLQAAEHMGLRIAHEVFADRAYNDDGTLVARREQGAVITDSQQAIQQILEILMQQKVTTITGKKIPIRADSICVHGDNHKALEFVKQIRKSLSQNHIHIVPMREIV